MIAIKKAFPPTPAIQYTEEGAGDIDLLCGGCGHVLVASALNANVVQNLVFQCPVCDSYNETRV